MPRGFHLLIAAQFFSALADNALLIVTIALLAQQNLPMWWAPMLKFAFTVSYVALAPFVGPLADSMPKARLMALMNGVKMIGVVGLLAGMNPIAAFAIVGFGAAAYAPAKYGLITEIVPAVRLVAANAWIEVSVVCAAVLGTVLGGVLVNDAVMAMLTQTAASLGLHVLDDGPSGALVWSLIVTLALYVIGGVLNFGVPPSGARYPQSRVDPRVLLAEFRHANRVLWHDRQGGLALAVTTIFWGAGATLQFIVLRWAEHSLGLGLDKAAVLQGVVAFGIVAGAALAGRFATMGGYRKSLWWGVGLGLMMPVMAAVESVPVALPLLVVIGAAGGLLVVPLNALLQHRGCTLLTAGRSIAAQGYNENLGILVMLASYAGLLALDVPITVLMSVFGMLVAAAILLLMLRERRRDAQAALATAVRRGGAAGNVAAAQAYEKIVRS